ncbi:hypothetical protein [uncultured Microbacterium sp.]|uniref:hypothetical protein n=1 Tax=uncultured Microbacterium sp. TaxID=191216 RepID=UPI002619B17D|nr:hypothetical protein [uncultured Microbacterium sp.]
MNSRLVVASFVVITSFALGGCSAGAQPRPVGASSAPAIEVEQAAATVDIRLARSLLDQEDALTDAQIVEAARGKGIAATVDGDTVVYTMTRSQQADMLAQMRSSAQESADELVADETNSVTAVEFNDPMTSFKVSVDRDRYGALESLLALGFYMQGAIFQQFNGVGADDIDVIVDFVDDASGEVLESGSYQEMRENLQQ